MFSNFQNYKKDVSTIEGKWKEYHILDCEKYFKGGNNNTAKIFHGSCSPLFVKQTRNMVLHVLLLFFVLQQCV